MSLMYVLLLTAICVAVTGLLLFIDIRVKGNFSVILKALSLIAVTIALSVVVLWYGQTILRLFNVNVKSLTNIKAFFSSRILAMLTLLLFFIFVFLKGIRLVISFKTGSFQENNKKEIVTALLSVVFDIAVIPNIISMNAFAIVLAILSLIGTGLACTRLVLSFINKKKEVIA